MSAPAARGAPSGEDWGLPEDLRPMLAVPGRLPEGDGWRYEMKWDGVRALAYVTPGAVRLVSRSGRDLTETYPELCDPPDPLGGRSALLDGEVVALLPDGRPSFQALQAQLRARRTGRGAAPLALFVFDVLALDDALLIGHSYDERRALLDELTFVHPRWSAPPAFAPPGQDVLDVSRQKGLEGVVAKRRSAPYLPGRRSDAWIKTKNFRTQEVVIGGWTEGEGRRAASFGSLLLGLPAADGLAYVGSVGTGFDEAALHELLGRLRELEVSASPFARRLPPLRGRRARFVRPALVGEVRFSEWTDDGRLRQPAWRGLRGDKAPSEVHREP